MLVAAYAIDSCSRPALEPVGVGGGRGADPPAAAAAASAALPAGGALGRLMDRRRLAPAFPMDAGAVQALVADLERKFNCKIQATVRVVPELIGGVRIAIGDEVIDASVRGKLAAMATALKN